MTLVFFPSTLPNTILEWAIFMIQLFLEQKIPKKGQNLSSGFEVSFIDTHSLIETLLLKQGEEIKNFSPKGKPKP